MAVTILGISLICLAGFGSCLRIVTEPQPYSDLTQELNISCITDGPTDWAKSIVSIQIMNENEDTIAVIDMRQQLKMGAGSKGNMKAEGQVDPKDASKSSLTLTIEKPGIKDAGVYTCLVFFTNEEFKIIEERVTGNITYQKPDITVIVEDLGRKLTSLLTRVQKQTNTLQTLNKQHITFKNTHSGQNQNIDIMTVEVERQNKVNTELNEQINKQNTLLNKLNTQIETLNTDNTQKQQQLDILIDYIQQQNDTIKIHELQLKSMAMEIASLDPEWKYYEADSTFIKAFGKNHSSRHLSWSNARKACQLFGGDLVQIRDQDKNDFVSDLYDGAGWQFPWIGAKNHATDNKTMDFKYVNGAGLGSYQPWLQGQPDGYGDNDAKCVGLSAIPSYPGVWFDDNCSRKEPYVCSITSLSVF